MQYMEQLDMYGKKKNKAKAYNPKTDEFVAFCDIYYEHMDNPHQVTRAKVEAYLTYCFYREQKPKGWGKKGANIGVAIDWVKANQVISVLQSCRIGKDGNPTPESAEKLKTLQPTKGCSYSFMNTTKCALKEMWQKQVDNRQNSYTALEVFLN